MSSFHITWRPSGGRGEYEYSPIDALYENKSITLVVPVRGTMHRIVTDTHLEKNAGKRRLRRANSNDRVRLSVPNLVAALAALPKPTRDRDNIATPNLSAGRWALGSAELEILSQPTDSTLVVRPLAIQPRHFENAIDVAERMKALEAEAALPGPLGVEASNHLAAVASGVNDVSLERSAQAVFDAFSDANADMPLLASPEEVEVAQALEKADETALPAATGTEGKKRVVAHVLRERDKGLVKKKKIDFRSKHAGTVFCECCGLTPVEMYGHDLDGIIEAHHKVPLNECADDEIRVTALDDLILLCRNCHGAIHRISPMPDLDVLRSLLRMRPQAV